MSEQRWTIPDSWSWVAAGEIARIVGGGTPSSRVEENFAEDGIPWITPADLAGYTGTYISRGRRDLSKTGYESSGASLMPPGSVLFSSRAPIGYCVIADKELSTNQGFKSLVLEGDISPQFIRYYLLSAKEYAEGKASGTTFLELSGSRVAGLAVPVAPLAEQERIVVKIDRLATRAARARADLDHIPALLENYRARILDLAFSGKLTEDFRGTSSKQGDIKSGFPEGWAVKSLGVIGEIQSGIQVGKKRVEAIELVDVPYLRVANVQRGWLNLDEVKTIAVTPAEKERLLLQKGDLLMNEGGDRDKLGRGWVWDGQIAECIHQNHVFRIRLKKNSLPPEFVSHYANEKGQQYFIDQGTQTTNLASISKRRVAALPVPIPPTEEAVEIVRRINSAFAWLDRVSADHAAASKLLPKLDAAILSTAFRGELVPQDPSHETASVLLARIRTQREKAPVPKQVRKARRRKAPVTMSQNLEEVLAKAEDWLPAQEVFRRCGIGAGAKTDAIEALYVELRALDKGGRLEVEAVTDENGRKLHDRLKLKVV